MEKKVLLFLGSPGAGKGTLARRCVEDLSYEQVSTGNLCREHVAQGSDIGKKIDLALKSGKLIDDSLITDMVIQWLQGNPQKTQIILDGYPRTIIQAEVFNTFAVSNEEINPLVVRLKVSEQAVIDRLSMRLICSNQGCQAVYSLLPGSGCSPLKQDICDQCAGVLIKRSDDEIDAIRKRLKLYSEHEQRLLDFYNARDYSIIDLDASKSVEDIFNEFKQRVIA